MPSKYITLPKVDLVCLKFSKDGKAENTLFLDLENASAVGGVPYADQHGWR